ATTQHWIGKHKQRKQQNVDCLTRRKLRTEVPERHSLLWLKMLAVISTPGNQRKRKRSSNQETSTIIKSPGSILRSGAVIRSEELVHRRARRSTRRGRRRSRPRWGG